MQASFSDPVFRGLGLRLVQEGLNFGAAVLGRPLPVSAETVVTAISAIEHKPSILQDVELGRPTEFEAMFDLLQMLGSPDHLLKSAR